MAILPRVVTEASASGAQVIDGSLTFDKSKEQYLTRTPSTAGNRKTFTWSVWLKRNRLADGSSDVNHNPVFCAGTSNSASTDFRFQNTSGGRDDEFWWVNWDGGTTYFSLEPLARYRDVSGFYHLVCNYDGTTAKVYINGSQVTDWDVNTQNGGTSKINSTTHHSIGCFGQGALGWFGGNMSQFYLIDGQALDATYFGYTDPLTNTWRPKKFSGNYNLMVDDATGGKPILLTSGGPYGGSSTTGSVDTTDPAKASLKIALPLQDDTTDVSNLIRGSGSAVTVTAVNAKYSSTYSKYYGAAGDFLDTTNDFSMQVSNSDGHFDIGTGNCCIEWWAYYPSTVSTNGYIFRSDTTNGVECYAYAHSSGTVAVKFGAFTWDAWPGSGGNHDDFSNGVWNHFCIERNGSTWTAYMNGAPMRTTSNAVDANPGDTMGIGNYNNANSVYHARCYLQDFRWYTASKYGGNAFTVPSLGTNSCYLPFDGKTPIGEDQSGKGNNWTPVNFGGSTVIPKATGALPILNTVSGGNVAVPGVRGQAGVAVTVYNSGSGNKYYLDGAEAGTVNFIPGQTVTFDTSDTTVGGHPFRLSPKSGGTHGTTDYSVDFDGSGDYLSLASSTDFEFGTGDFTLECWIYPVSTSADVGFPDPRAATTNAVQCMLGCNSSLQLFVYVNGSHLIAPGVGTVMEANTWQHVCYTRSGTTGRLFLNGLQIVSVTDSNTYVASGMNYGWHAWNGGVLNGKISDARIVKGTAVYTSDFQPPSVPLTNITNTKLLCCNQSTVTGATVTPGTITANGDPSASTDSPYDTYPFGTVTGASEGSVGAATTITIPNNAPSTLYYYCTNHSGMGGSIGIGAIDSNVADSYAWKNVLALPLNSIEDVSNRVNPAGSTKKTITVQGNTTTSSVQSNFYHRSCYFDGTGDDLTVTGSSSFAFGTGDFTIEFWLYLNESSPNNKDVFANPGGIQLFFVSGKLRYNHALVAGLLDTDNTITQSKWTHCALVRNSGTTRWYIDGIQNSGSYSDSKNWTQTTSWYVGSYNGSIQHSNIYLNDLRVYKGIAKYTSNFIPASTNPDILPDTPSGVVYGSELTKTTSGGVSGDASTSDYLQMASSSDFSLDGDFTVEWWYFRPSKDNAFMWTIHDSNTSTGLELYWGSSGSTLKLFTNGSATHQNATYRSGWSHYAVVRSGSTITAYYNGVAQSGTLSNSNTFSGNVTIGGEYYNGAITGGLSGPISNFRLVKGTAVYTQNFAPPTSPLTNITNTKLLCCQSNSSALTFSVSPTISDDYSAGVYLKETTYSDRGGSSCTVTNNGSVTSSSAGTNPFGITDAAAITGTQRIDLNMGNVSGTFFQSAWTLEMFFKKSGGPNDADNWFVGTSTDGSSWQSGWSIEHSGSGTGLNWNYSGGSSISTNITLEADTWYFMRVQRTPGSNTALKFWVYDTPTNLVGSYSGTASDASTQSNNVLKIGDANGNANNLGQNWMFSNVMITAGTKANQNVPTLSSGVRVDSASVSAGIIPFGNVAATTSNPFDTDIDTVIGKDTGYATLNPLESAAPLNDGNLQQGTSSGWQSSKSTIGLSSGRWYWETQNMQDAAAILGVADQTASSYPSGSIFGSTGHGGGDSNPAWTWAGANYYFNATSAATGLSNHSSADIVQYALDVDTGRLWFGRNGLWYNSSWDAGANPADGTNQTVSITTGRTYMPAGTVYDGGALWNFGQKPFKFPPPEGFQPINLANLPRPGLTRPDQYVGVATYTGNGSTQSLTGLGFQPDLVWIKVRTGAYNHVVYDSVRGPSETLESSAIGAENDRDPYGVTSFDTDGFSVKGLTNGDYQVNGNPGGTYAGSTGGYVGWCWKAGGNKNTFNIDGQGYSSAAAAGLDGGNINPTGCSIGTQQGFSILKYAGNQGTGQTLNHGLGEIPDFVICKNLGTSYNWFIWHESFGNGADAAIYFTDAAKSTGYVTQPFGTFTTSSLAFNNNDGVNGNYNYICYAWKNVPGVQKFGSYKGNQNTNGPFVDLGFRPAILMIKSSSASSTNWRIIDNERRSYNWGVNDSTSEGGPWLKLSSNAVEANERPVDFLSNGFKIQGAWGGDINYDSGTPTYIYAAWAHQPYHNLYGGQSNAR